MRFHLLATAGLAPVFAGNLPASLPARTAPKSRAGARRAFAADEEVFAEGDRATSFYKVVSGMVRTYKLLSDGRRQIVGFLIEGRSAAPRSHYPLSVDGREVGFVTSGAFSPTLDQNLGLGLVEADVAGIGKPIDVIIRDRAVAAKQVKTPFYKRERS